MSDMQRLEINYLTKALEEWGHIGPNRVSLQNVYVPLHARQHLPQRFLREGEEPLFPDVIPSVQEEIKPRGSEPTLTLDEVLNQALHIVLMGIPGSGKTITLQYIALSYACGGLRRVISDAPCNQTLFSNLDERQRLPFLLRASELLSALTKYDQWALEHALLLAWHRWISTEIRMEQIVEWESQGRLAVLIDGLDEVQPGQREKVSKEIHDFSRRAPQCRLVVSTRSAGYIPLGGSFREYALLPLDERLAQTLLQCWLSVLPNTPAASDISKRAEKAWKIIQSTKSLRVLAKTPMTLKMIAEVLAEATPPEMAGIHNRSELYKRYITRVLWQRAEARGASPQDKSWAFALLEAWAWARHTCNASKEEDLRRTWENAQLLEQEDEPSWQRSRRLLREQVGLLSVQQTETATFWTFTHPTWEEFFVARYLQHCWQENPEGTWCFLKPRLHADKWQEPILLLAGQLKGATSLVHRIRTAHSPRERFLHRDLTLSLEMINQGIKVSEKEKHLVGRDVLRLFQRWKRYARHSWLVRWRRHLAGHPRLAFYLFASLQILGILEVIPPLLVAQTLKGHISLVSRIKETIQPLLKNPDPYIRATAVEMLAETEPEQSVPQFFELFWQEDDENVQVAILKALGKSSRGEFASFFLSLLSHPNQAIREVCAQNLAQLSAQSLPSLERFILMRDNFIDSRLNAIEALSLMGSHALDTLRRLLRHDEEEIREAALDALQAPYISEFSKLLGEVLYNDESPAVRIAAINALERWKSPKSAEFLAVALEDEEPEVRERAVEALSQIDPLPASLLEQTFRSDDPGIRSWAVESIGRLRLRDHTHLLLHTFDNPEEDETVRAAAIRGLAYLDLPPDTPPTLLNILQNPTENPVLRAASAWALGHLYRETNREDILGVLVSSLHAERHEEVFREIIVALAEIGGSQAQITLRDLFYQDVPLSIRGTVIEAVGQLNDKAIEKDLIRTFNSHESLAIRIAAARALSYLSTSRGITELLQNLADPVIGAEIKRLLEHVPKDKIAPSLLHALHGSRGDLLRFTIEEIAFWARSDKVDYKPWLREAVSILQQRLFDGDPTVANLTHETLQWVVRYLDNHENEREAVQDPCVLSSLSLWARSRRFAEKATHFVVKEIILPLFREILMRKLGQ